MRDWREVTRAGDVDLVLVLTPNDSHAEISLDALAHGKHVLCEKPLAHTLEAARAMYEGAVASGRVHQVGFVYRKWPAAAFARRLVAAGELGEVVHYRGWFFHDHGLDPALPLTWRLRKAVSGGGSGTDIGSHVVDLARCLVGEIDGVFARSRTHFGRRPDRPGETGAVDEPLRAGRRGLGQMPGPVRLPGVRVNTGVRSAPPVALVQVKDGT